MTRGCKRKALKRLPGKAGQSGAVLVELAIILPLLLLLSFATLEFARAITAYKTLVNQVRVAARYLAAKTPGAGHAEAQCLLRYGHESCTGTLLLPGLATATITIKDASNETSTHRAQYSGGAGGVTVNLVSVTVSGFSYRLAAAGFLTGIFGSATAVTFGPISVTMRQVM